MTVRRENAESPECKLDKIGFYKIEHNAELEGRRVALKLTDDSLLNLGIKPGHIVIGVRNSTIQWGGLSVIDHFDTGVIIRRLFPCDCDAKDKRHYRVYRANFVEPLEEHLIDEEFNYLGYICDLNL